MKVTGSQKHLGHDKTRTLPNQKVQWIVLILQDKSLRQLKARSF